ncbi:hypothetical protein J9978_08825 [Chromobacterium violaceum]|uniref:hypothetical protein n=1 Tax=Chromobacterium violaceum TaxID=536 RepID=UPI0009DA661E|nr:hypothetical protein [Chromobacterium violaceum]MBP4049601.1 hypothetical protein [Chromobacterium violaceum]OQS28720.1 hypothetical protein B0T41_04895 [Chromobacterium violaceum]
MKRILCLLPLTFCLAAWAADNEQIQGQGGRILRYSSTQVRVEPSADDVRSYLQARDARLEGASVAAALQAGRKALERLGYGRVDVDADYGVIRAEKDEKLISEARQVLRGLLKLKFPLPGKPDHQTTEVLLTLKPGTQPRQVLLRANIRQTVWDSNGNSRALLCSDPAVYRQLFDQLSDALGRSN